MSSIFSAICLGASSLFASPTAPATGRWKEDSFVTQRTEHMPLCSFMRVCLSVVFCGLYRLCLAYEVPSLESVKSFVTESPLGDMTMASIVEIPVSSWHGTSHATAVARTVASSDVEPAEDAPPNFSCSLLDNAHVRCIHIVYRSKTGPVTKIFTGPLAPSTAAAFVTSESSTCTCSIFPASSSEAIDSSSLGRVQDGQVPQETGKPNSATSSPAPVLPKVNIVAITASIMAAILFVAIVVYKLCRRTHNRKVLKASLFRPNQLVGHAEDAGDPSQAAKNPEFDHTIKGEPRYLNQDTDSCEWMPPYSVNDPESAKYTFGSATV
ncbi:unnamed protein product [Mycena citricolor]|uniref:Uncharacterized protein n=1 Tax=Mycena citricolor TaxID=2018698 RepID=A0AAD2GTW1_9AGAR|nr:unnamed protein product [Mycena citricolor]